jgi:hypothetical protein
MVGGADGNRTGLRRKAPEKARVFDEFRAFPMLHRRH